MSGQISKKQTDRVTIAALRIEAQIAIRYDFLKKEAPDKGADRVFIWWYGFHG